MTSFLQSACVAVLLTASTAAAQPAGAPSKAPQPGTLHSSLAPAPDGGVNNQTGQEGGDRVEQLPAEQTAADVSLRSRLATGESLWRRWNDLP